MNSCGRHLTVCSAGFTLIELLVAAGLVIVVTSAVAALALPMRRAFDRGLSTGELASRGRSAMYTMVSAARNAGSGVVLAPAGVTLDDVIPVVSVAPPSTITIARASGPQGLLREAVSAGAVAVQVDDSGPCSSQAATCGMHARDLIAIFDAAKGETVTVSAVNIGSGILHLASPLRHAYDPGAVLATIEQTVFALRDRRLVRLTTGGAEQPIADHIAAFNVTVAAGRLDLQLTLDQSSVTGAPLDLRTSVAFRK
jgi:hypothetical protein